MPDDTLAADVRFGRQVLLACTAIIVIQAVLLSITETWWHILILGWIGLGATSVAIQIVTDFGYIRLVPRFDALYSYTLSIIAGPFSLVRTLLDLA